MATKTEIDVARVASIANDIYAAVTPITGADDAAKDAQSAFQEATAAKSNLREDVMVVLAGASQQGQWTIGEIDLAAAQIGKRINNLESAKALGTFVSEAKRAMHPKVRAHVPFLKGLKDQVWTNEGQQDKGLPQPCRKAFKRGYHMFLRMMGEAAVGNLLETAADVVAFADANDPDMDPKKVRARMDAMVVTLQGFANDFPVEQFTGIVEFFQEITVEAMKAARQGLVKAQADVTESHTLAPVPAVVEARVEAAKAEEAAADGLFDVDTLLAA